MVVFVSTYMVYDIYCFKQCSIIICLLWLVYPNSLIFLYPFLHLIAAVPPPPQKTYNYTTIATNIHLFIDKHIIRLKDLATVKWKVTLFPFPL